MTELELLHILGRAHQSALGICVKTNSPERLRAKLYPVMRKNNFSGLSLSISPNADELWIVKNEPDTA
jgi:hypothetical protein